MSVHILKSSVENTGPRREDIEQLTEAIVALKNSSAKSNSTPEIKSIASDIKQIQAAFERSNDSLKHEPEKLDLNNGARNAVNQIEALKPLANMNEQKSSVTDSKKHPETFVLPNTAKGYAPVKIKGVKTPYCPPSELKTGVPITVGFTLGDKNLFEKSSPLIFSISRIDGPLNLTQIEEIQVPLLKDINSYTSYAKLPSAEYKISYRYFIKDRLEGEYPSFYSLDCKVLIKPES